MRTAHFIPTLALALGMCTPAPPEIVLVQPEPAPLVLPAECTSRDPAWAVLPDTAIKKTDLPRNARSNELQYGDLLGKREICRAAINASKKDKTS